MVNQNPSGRSPSLRQTETTIAYLPTRRTHPSLVHQGLDQTLPVAIQKTGGTKLPPDAPAVFIVAHCFCVDGFLAALMACGSLDAVVDLVGASRCHFDVASGSVRTHIVQLNRQVWCVRGDSSATEGYIQKL